ncbi:hypothetical protein GA0116948_101316 [Chitinophaga costaii]|uniref:O-antigen ligase-related domain-containing protein n=1 Tax=Chitinophaga costaii TaxID=1335309 RepID=A0A1C3ZAX6_9BACT|nr:O-antigen ligase family protein [Chitinophaga costaii]PUZ30300.1 O-antigen ligase domain-containing protein [Chitinophaga costaii]SCB79534.1 hypothetical protein GA0116948_101316 [Chitinophaga costaii]
MQHKATLNFYRWLFVTAILPYAGGFLPFLPQEIGGLNLSGFAWLIMLLVALVRILAHPSAISMPGWMWMPWMLLLIGQWLSAPSFYGLQGTLQYLVFYAVGMAASTLPYADATLQVLKKWFVVYMSIICIGFGLQLAGVHVMAGGANTIMTLVVFTTLLLSDYFWFNNRTALLLAGVMALYPIVGVTRMGILMMLSVTALHAANRNLAVKVLAGVLTIGIGIAVFYSDSFQQKTFYSGHGDLGSISLDDKDFNTSGRLGMWKLTSQGLADHPWMGSGARADLAMLQAHNFKIKELHNDFIAVRYNYGWVGLGCLLFGFIMQFVLLKRKRASLTDAYTAMLYDAGLTLFIAWAGFMYSDNALKYSNYFGNLHFCVIAIVYSRLKHGTTFPDTPNAV